ncbi:hypothetical protein [Actinomadura sp. CNU-125]|uniref:hypothetical protein n=1 Tax=Actinomadura sp. CNU-125 TaxID=1904961 RepID=UPI0021CCF5D0|nr:hypothetical protein [Actinomadura sp. CNU-125]
MQRRARDGQVDLHLPVLRRAPVTPTAATSGSVNTTCGTAWWSAVAAYAVHGPAATSVPAARAAITSPTTRAAYLP